MCARARATCECTSESRDKSIEMKNSELDHIKYGQSNEKSSIVSRWNETETFFFAHQSVPFNRGVLRNSWLFAENHIPIHLTLFWVHFFDHEHFEFILTILCVPSNQLHWIFVLSLRIIRVWILFYALWNVLYLHLKPQIHRIHLVFQHRNPIVSFKHKLSIFSWNF